jgi:hypothetical protein
MAPVKTRSSIRRLAPPAEHGTLILRSILLACLLLLVRLLGGELSSTVIVVLVAAIFGPELLPDGFIQIGTRREPPAVEASQAAVHSMAPPDVRSGSPRARLPDAHSSRPSSNA